MLFSQLFVAKNSDPVLLQEGGRHPLPDYPLTSKVTIIDYLASAGRTLLFQVGYCHLVFLGNREDLPRRHQIVGCHISSGFGYHPRPACQGICPRSSLDFRGFPRGIKTRHNFRANRDGSLNCQKFDRQWPPGIATIVTNVETC